MLDAMSIKQQVEFDSRKQVSTGFVDLGGGSQTDEEAKEVLVIMLVGLRGHWKSPIAYYFTKGLQAEVQKQLVHHCMEKVQEMGFKIHVLTMDGHASNIGMVKLFGANMSLTEPDFNPSFHLPNADHPTFVMLDACHMLKLVRNTLEACGTICAPDGPVVWQLIRDLQQTQEQIGLRLGNKLTPNHVSFHQQKMKVSLAVQALSASVAAALETLKSLNIRKFSYAGPTINFIKVLYWK